MSYIIFIVTFGDQIKQSINDQNSFSYFCLSIAIVLIQRCQKKRICQMPTFGLKKQKPNQLALILIIWGRLYELRQKKVYIRSST